MSQAGAGQARARLQAVLFFVTLALVVFVPVLRADRVFCFRDLADYAIPHKVWAAGELLAGRIPLWNPWNYCGFPHLANLQSGALYPPNVVATQRCSHPELTR